MEALIVLGWIFAVLLILAGLAGTVVPGLPGAPALFLGFLLLGWTTGFERVGFWTLGLLGLLAVFSVVIDFLLTAAGAKRFGAGRAAILGASVGLLVGLFFGLPGLLLGPFLGAAAGHALYKREAYAAFRAGVGATVGVVAGVVAKIGITLAMLVIFAVAWWT